MSTLNTYTTTKPLPPQDPFMSLEFDPNYIYATERVQMGTPEEGDEFVLKAFHVDNDPRKGGMITVSFALRPTLLTRLRRWWRKANA